MPTSKKEEQPGPKTDEFNRPYQFDDSDITLVSSDDLKFKIQTYHLMGASVVFRNMIAAGRDHDSQKEVTLTDKTIEDGEIISLFLSICYGNDLKLVDHENSAKYFRLIAFANKYDCKPAMTLIRLSLRACLAKPAVSHTSSWSFQEPPKNKETTKEAAERLRAVGDIPGSSVLDLSGVSYDNFTSIPDNYKYALLRATRQGKNLVHHNTTDWKAVSEAFKLVLDATRQPNKG